MSPEHDSSVAVLLSSTMASCGYSSFLEKNTACGGNDKCITLKECNRKVDDHLKFCKVWLEDLVVDEKSLLLARAGKSILYMNYPNHVGQLLDEGKVCCLYIHQTRREVCKNSGSKIA